MFLEETMDSIIIIIIIVLKTMNAMPSGLNTPWFGRLDKTQEYLFLYL
jgi:hypothetical protein